MIENLKIHKNHFKLHPSGAIYWEEKKMLLIADVHLGKVAHFRKHGAPVPANAAFQNLEKRSSFRKMIQLRIKEKQIEPLMGGTQIISLI